MSTASKARTRERPLVLVVEDYEDTLDIIEETLLGEGYDVATARTGTEAIDKATSLVPDLVLMDLSLPEVDGWEATRRLKTNELTEHIRVVALSAHALEQHAQRASAAGCDSFVTKPFTIDQLVQEVRRVLATAEPERV